MTRSSDRIHPYMRDDMWIKDTGKICFWRHPEHGKLPSSDKAIEYFENWIAEKLKNTRNTAILEDKPQ
jgi:hypothetical protein